MPQNPVARALIKAAGVPIAAPSANTSGLPSPTNAKYVIEDMRGRIDAVIDGGSCEFGIESTVITLAGEIPTILRPGAITREMMSEVIGRVDIAKASLPKAWRRVKPPPPRHEIQIITRPRRRSSS